MIEAVQDGPKYAERISELGIPELQIKLTENIRALGVLKVTTPVRKLIDYGVEPFGGRYDALRKPSGDMTITGANLFAAIRDAQRDIAPDTHTADQLLLHTSHTAVVLEELKRQGVDLASLTELGQSPVDILMQVIDKQQE